MHELSIAINLVSLAVDAAENAGSPPIEAVCIRVGDAAGVVIEALEFAWKAATEGTACAGARLEIERVPIRVHCDACHTESDLTPPLRFCCPKCDTPTLNVIAGRELDLIALEVAEEHPSGQPRASHAATHP